MYTLSWKIENFLIASESGCQISSPKFITKELSVSEWELSWDAGEKIYGSVFLTSYGSNKKAEKLSAHISCQTNQGALLKLKEFNDYNFTPCGPLEIRKITCLKVPIDELEEKEETLLLQDGSVVVVCQLFTADKTSPKIVYHGRTHFGTTRTSKVWNIDLSRGYESPVQTICFLSGKEDEPYLKLSGALNKRHKCFRIKLETIESTSYFGSLTVLNKRSSEKITIKLSNRTCTEMDDNCPDFIWEKDIEGWSLSLLCNFLIFNDKDVYAIDCIDINCIPEDCEHLGNSWVIPSFRTVNSKFFRDQDSQTVDCCKPNDSISLLQKHSDILETCDLRSDLINLCKEQKYCDAILRAGSRRFLVHKTVLCARSQRFRDLFEHSNIEKTDGVKHAVAERNEKVELCTPKTISTIDKFDLPEHYFEGFIFAIQPSVYAGECSEPKPDNKPLDYASPPDIPDTSNTVENTSKTERTPLFPEESQLNLDEENRVVIDICDVDAETLNLLLTYIYTDTVEEDIDVVQAAKLYVASSTYNILSLKEKCTDMVKLKMEAVKICSVLQVLDKESETEIAKNIEKYFCEHYEDILPLPEWKTYSEKNVNSANNLMYKALMYSSC